jgi:RNA polymerase sigma-70 factor, ECF subfamily
VLLERKKRYPQTVSWEDKDLDNLLESILDIENISFQKLTHKYLLKIINNCL